MNLLMLSMDPKSYPYIANALAIVFVGLLNIGFSYYWIFIPARKGKRSDVEREITARACAINELYANNDIQSPYGYHLMIPNTDNKVFNANTAALLNQLDLLRLIFYSQNILDKKTVESHVSWARFLLAPWINNDLQLKEYWELFKGKDIADDFVEWAAEFIDNPTKIRR